MKQIVYISFFLLCVISCSKRYDKVRLIAGDSYQYWFCVNSDSDVKTKFYIYFDRKGKKYTIEERYSDKKCYLYDGGDVETLSYHHNRQIPMGRHLVQSDGYIFVEKTTRSTNSMIRRHKSRRIKETVLLIGIMGSVLLIIFHELYFVD